MIKKNRLGFIFAVVFIDFLGFSFIFPLYPEIARRFDLSALAITLLATAYALMQFLFSPVFGRLSDRFGRKPILVVSSLGAAVSFLFFGLAGSVWLLFVSRIFNGIFGSSGAVAQAYVADLTTSGERAKGMGFIGAALGLGLIFGPALAGFLGRFGFGAPAFGAAAIAFFNAFFIILMLKESLPRPLRSRVRPLRIGAHLKGLGEVLRHPIMTGILITYFLAMLALAAIQNIAILFADERFHLTVEESGYFFVFLGAVLVLTQGLLVGRAVKHWGESVLAMLGIMIMLAGFAATPFIENVAVIVFAAGVIALGAGLCLPSLNALISKNAAEGEQGETLGLAQGLIGAALVVGPVLGGFLFDVFGSGSPFFAAAALALASLFFAARFFRRLKAAERRGFFVHHHQG